MDSASARAFGIVEVLEKILLVLPTKDLLLAQAVCKTWKTTIDASPTLQKALFFQPVTKEFAYYHEHQTSYHAPGLELSRSPFFLLSSSDASDLRATLKHFKSRKCNAEFGELHSDINKLRIQTLQHAPDITKATVARTRVFLNPLLLVRFRWLARLFELPHPTFSRVPDISPKFESDIHPSARHPEASWRRMLITQPPLGVLWAEGEFRHAKSRSRWPFDTENILCASAWEKPITMSQLRRDLAPRSGQVLDVLKPRDAFEIWEDGACLEKIERSRTKIVDSEGDVGGVPVGS